MNNPLTLDRNRLCLHHSEEVATHREILQCPLLLLSFVFELFCDFVFIGLSVFFLFVYVCSHICQGEHVCVCESMNAHPYGAQRLLPVITLD